MPSIPPDHMHMLIKHFVGIRPSSILDIGLSYGKIGFVNRDFFIALMDESFVKKKSKMTIHGIETFSPEPRDMQPGFYDTVYRGDMFDLIDRLGTYDMIVLGDVLEHLGKKEAFQLLDECIVHSNKHLMICVSLGEEWIQEEFRPFVFPQEFFQYTTENYGVFLVNKDDYIDHKIDKLYPSHTNNGLRTAVALRKKFSLNRENISKIDLSGYAEYANHLERDSCLFETRFMEHYRLLAYLSTCFSDATIVDVGTNLGHSAIALSYNNTNKVISYDIVEYSRPPDLKQPPNIEYRTGDVLEDERLFDSALIMLDTDHGGAFEKRFYSSLKENGYKGLLFLDDIYLNEPMRAFWSSISEPKEDITDLGHWAGSGLVEFS
jgi:hypothetical protein